MVKSFKSPDQIDLADLWTPYSTSNTAETVELEDWTLIKVGAWDTSNATIGRGGIKIHNAARGFANSTTLKSKINLKSRRINSFSFSGSSTGATGSKSRSHSSSYLLKITDGTHNQTICSGNLSFSTGTGTVIKAAGYSEILANFTTEFDGTKIKIGFISHIAYGSVSTSSSSATASMGITDGQEIDISGWGNTYLQAELGTNSTNDGHAVKIFLSNIVSSKKLINSKKKLSQIP